MERVPIEARRAFKDTTIAMAMNTSLKKNLRSFNLFRDYSNSLCQTQMNSWILFLASRRLGRT